MKRRLVLLAVLTAVAALTSSAAEAQTAETTPRLTSLVQPSIVYLETSWSAQVYDKFNRRLLRDEPFEIGARCSGFFVSPDGHIGTAAHCIETTKQTKDDLRLAAAEYATTCDCYYQGQPSVDDVVGDYTLRNLTKTVNAAYGVAASGLPTGRAFPAQVLGIRSYEPYAGDVALLKINGENTPGLKLAPDADVEVLDPVVSIGYPAVVDYVKDATFDPEFRDGKISSKGTKGAFPIYGISAAVSGGMSGGPTVDPAGRVIGVNSFGINQEIESQPFNYISPSATLADLMKDKGVANELGTVNATYREGLQAYYAGEKDTALQKFDDVLAIVPSHQLAQQFKSKAEQLPDESSGFPWLWLLVGLGVAVAVIVLIGLLISRSRSRPAPAQPAFPQAPPLAPPPSLPPPRPAAQATRLRDASDSAPALVVKSGGQAGARFPVTSELVIGRENVDVLLDDSEASRQHARIRPVDGRLEISDLSSANGTFVNDTKITATTPLSNGDVIEIGTTRIEVVLPELPATVPGRADPTPVRDPRP